MGVLLFGDERGQRLDNKSVPRRRGKCKRFEINRSASNRRGTTSMCLFDPARHKFEVGAAGGTLK
jgi:hypothetical protein